MTARQNAQSPSRKPLTGPAAADVGLPDARAGTESGDPPSPGADEPPAVGDGAAADCALILDSRHRANSFVNRCEMSEIIPRPYWATAPLIVRSASRATFVPPSTASRRETTRAEAAPLPFCSMPWALSTTRCPASSRSCITTVPAKDRATGPTLLLVLPFQV